MVMRLASYPYGTVRARALATRLLSAEQILQFAGQTADSTASRIEKLPESVGGDSAEERLHRAYLDFGRRVIAVLPGRLGPVFTAFLARNHVENLLAACRYLLRKEPSRRPGRPLPTLHSHPRPDPSECENLEQFVTRLPETPYREALEACARPETGRDFGACEDALLRTYWEGVDRAVSRLPLFDRPEARDLLGLRADIDASRIILRACRRQRSPAETAAGWPALTRHFPAGRLHRLPCPEAAEDSVMKLLGARAGKKSGGDVETVLWRELNREARQALRHSPLGIGVPLAALLLKEQETLDLLGLLGGQRYRLPAEEIRPLLRSGGS